MIRIIGSRRLWTAIGCAAAAGALLWWPSAAAQGVSRGLSLCGGVLIPSLFPFLVLGGVLTRSGAADAIGRRLSPLTRWVFGLSGCSAPALLVGMLGGYPAGATAVADLYRRGALSRSEARRLLRFCVCAGPAFAVGAVGGGMMGSRRFGWLLFAAHLLAALLIGIASRRRPSDTSAPIRPADPFPVALVNSVTAACETVLYLCGFVILFGAIVSVCTAAGVPPLSAVLLEVSNGCAAAADAARAIGLLGFALGFGGLSVHCQIAAATRGTDLLSRGFFAARIAHGLLGGALTYLLCRLFPTAAPVFGSGDTPTAVLSAESTAVSVCLLVLCGIRLLIIPTGFFRKDVV